VPTYPRHSVVLAQQALTTALATDRRLALGIGAAVGHPPQENIRCGEARRF